MLPDDVEWQETEAGAQLVHSGLVIAKAVAGEAGVRVTTRCYINGYQQSRELATLAIARQYLEAWWARWEPDIRREVGNKLKGGEPFNLPGDPVYPDIKARPMPFRRRR